MQVSSLIRHHLAGLDPLPRESAAHLTGARVPLVIGLAEFFAIR
jgi:hypothetical protein